jgi:hypothetical protein
MYLIVWEHELTGYATQKRVSYEVQQIGNQEHAKGYGTHKKVSYEVQPISVQECAKRIREVRKCEKAAKYVI